jgi:hypothetical protein
MLPLFDYIAELIGRSAPTTGAYVPVNRDYYDRIKKTLTAIEKPTVQDGINAMCAQGNRDYYEHDWRGDGRRSYLKRRGIEDKFPCIPPNHEIGHLLTRAGHTPQQEFFVLAFALGLDLGQNIERYELSGELDFKKYMDDWIQYYVGLAKPYQHVRRVPVDPPSKTDWAIYFAAGLYMHAKVDDFKAAGLLHADYETQRAFCEDYAKRDSAPKNSGILIGEAEDITHAPYALIELSKEEWRGIIAVATGLRTPEETPYPERLSAIKKVLDYTKLGQDLRGQPRFADLVAKNAATNCTQR